ncbi:MAG TPA: acyltransferase [Porticoccaceae bacterium]|nr:acyltransferase [Porticoccaceae bacterium]HIK79394.1 acyltransferase [Porticoccaceae bacterium]
MGINKPTVHQDQTPVHLRANRGAVSRWLGRTVLRILGWRVQGQIPDLKRLLVIGAPHTSNWDFVLAMATILGLNLRMRWLAKHTIFKRGVVWFMEWLGGIPTDRTQPQTIVESVARLARKGKGVVIGITPEGTRRKAPKWKTGFLRLAKALDCPILMVAVNFPTKTIVIGDLYHPSGNNNFDLVAIKQYYDQFQGIHKDQF